jgi:hypothetical protein
MKSKYMCAQCKLKEAKWYCQRCVNYYCDECNQLIHYGNNVTENNSKSVFKHKECLKIDYSTRPGKCSIHPERDAEYYCEDCKRTICGYCRFKGAHNKGLQSQHQLEDIYAYFNKTKNQNQNGEYEEKKKNGYNTIRKITDQIKIIDQKMESHRNDIEKDYNEKRNDMKKKSQDAKMKVFQYIQALREIKRNLLYFKEYFTDREKYLTEQKNDPELAFVWSVHKEIIQEYLLYMEEMKKEDLSKIANDLDVTMPNVIITNESFGFNKAKVQTEISNKRNNTKNDGFEQKQKDENYSIIEKTRNLITELRKRMKNDNQKEVVDINRKSKKKDDNNSNFDNNEDATTEHSFLGPK